MKLEKKNNVLNLDSYIEIRYLNMASKQNIEIKSWIKWKKRWFSRVFQESFSIFI